MGALALVFSGCRKEAEKPSASSSSALPANSPAVYMNDPVFRKQLADGRREREAVLRERAPLVARMEALAKAHDGKREELEKLDEWNDLYKQVEALNAKYEKARRRQLKVAADRLNPKAK